MKTIKLLIAGFFSIALAACGGGGGSSSGDTPVTPTTAVSGILTDSPIAGIAYTTSPSGLSGTTDATGAYNFKPGDTVQFNLGSLILGNVTATGIVTPIELANGNANILGNLLVLFQSLDSNGGTSGFISIPSGAAAAITTPTQIDLTTDPATFSSSANTGLVTAMNGGNINTPIVSTVDAKANFLAQSMTLLSSNVWVDSGPNGNALLWRMTPAGEFIFGEANAISPGVEHGATTLTGFDVKGYQASATVDLDTNAANGGIFPVVNTTCSHLRTNGDQLIWIPSQLVNGSCVDEPENTFSKSENNPTGIVGVWALGSPSVIETQTFSFFSNGKYLMVDPIGDTAQPSCGGPGVEAGSYTYNASTKILKISNLTYDTNGCAGLSDSGAATTGIPFTIDQGGMAATSIDQQNTVFTMFRVSKSSIVSTSSYAGTWTAVFKLKTIGNPNLCGGTPADIDVAQNIGSIVIDSAGNFIVMNDLNLSFPMVSGNISASGQLKASWYGDTLLPISSGGSLTCPAGTVSGTMTDTSNGIVTLSQGGDTGTITLTRVP